MAVDASQLQQWIGRAERRTDLVTAFPLAALAATLDLEPAVPAPGTPIDPLRHWLYFLPIARRSEIGPDGHPKRGGFLPPIELPRRMWAGGRLEFLRPIRVGDAIERVSTIANVEIKTGRTGTLAFVLVRHEINVKGEVAVREEHDIVYRDNPRPTDVAPPRKAAPTDAALRRKITPDDVLLFRYSALTFNGHRIHYDRRYVTEVEGYPGLIVHGPLQATLLADLAREAAAPAAMASFSFRAISPTFDIAPFEICARREGQDVKLWVQDLEGQLAMEAAATFR
jgi:3-methylfumaryl-CoA hydratase